MDMDFKEFKKILKNNEMLLKFNDLFKTDLMDYQINDILFLIDKKNKKNIFIGISGSKEYFIRNNDNLFFYDFTILSKKIIIEFNGKAFHPNWTKYDIDYLIDNFKYKTIKKENITKKINNEKLKIETAKKNGFEILILWEEDGLEKNLLELKNFLKNKNINYEN